MVKPCLGKSPDESTRPCKYCDGPVAYNAKRCPHCDGKNPYPTKLKDIFGGCLLLLLIAIGVSFCNKDVSNDGIKKDIKNTETQSLKIEQPNKARILELKLEWQQLKRQNQALSGAGITDAEYFAENDRRIMKIIQEIHRLESL